MLLSAVERFSGTLFNLVFPDDCRLCEQPLTNISRIPVCPTCLALPKPLEAEFFCRACRTPFVDDYPLDEHDLCTVCRESLVNFDTAYSFGSYEGPLRKLIHLFKYGKVETLAQPLSRLLAKALPLDHNFDLVIAMPMHWRKQWERGFNQAELLANHLSRSYGIPLVPALDRIVDRGSQVGRSGEDRWLAVEGAFACTNPGVVRNRRLVILDDVITTGATISSCAVELAAAGAASVRAISIARG